MNNKKYTIDNFKMNTVINKSDGYWSVYSQKFDVDYSTILTRLIQSAGRWCVNYASDLFIDWNSINNSLSDPDFQGGVYLFGFRRMGVDGVPYIICNAKNGKNLDDYYGEILRLEITIKDNSCEMVLGTVNV